MSAVLERLGRVAPLSESLTDHLSGALKVMELPKKKIWLHKGHICRNIAFIEHGLFRCYYEKYGTEVTSWFMAEGDVMISVKSFFAQRPSVEAIEALEDSLIFYMDHDQLQRTYQMFPEFNEHGRKLTELYYMMAEDRLEGTKMLRAPEKYAQLQREYPHLVQRVPAKYLASYLGIAEETLSRIKSVFDRASSGSGPTSRSDMREH